MKSTLQPGATSTVHYVVPPERTVPHLYPDAPEFAAMPAVFATGYMVGLMEWTCLKLMAPHLDEGEGSLGVAINVNHAAATLPCQASSRRQTIRQTVPAAKRGVSKGVTPLVGVRGQSPCID